MEFWEAPAPSEPIWRLAVMDETNFNLRHVAELQKAALNNTNSQHLHEPQDNLHICST